MTHYKMPCNLLTPSKTAGNKRFAARLADGITIITFTTFS